MKKYLALLTALSVFAPMSVSAVPINVSFSFMNATGTVPGAVIGHIDGLDSNMANQTASAIVIDSFPVALGAIANTNVHTWTNFLPSFFTTVAGSITDFSIAATNSGNTFCLGYDNGCFGTGTEVSRLSTTLGDVRDVGSTTVMFNITMDGSTPPPPNRSIVEPGTFAMFGLGLAGLGAIRRRRSV